MHLASNRGAFSSCGRAGSAVCHVAPCAKPLARPCGPSWELTHSRRRPTVCTQSAKDFYEVLGVSKDADARAVKAAYRSKALKLHPDVNKALDAQERFMEAKTAFEVLTDPTKRADYDRALRSGFSGSWGRSYSGPGSRKYGSPYGAGRPPRKPADNYDLNDFLRDLEREVNDWRKERGKGKAGGSSSSSSSSSSKKSSGRTDQLPKSLWEELDEIGEEVLEDLGGLAEDFVSFLEQSLGLEEDKPKTSSTSGGTSTTSTGGTAASSGSSSASSSTYGSTAGRSSSASDTSSRTDPSGSTAGGTGSAPTRPDGPKPPPKKTMDEEVDVMLQELKRKLGKS